jgi:glycosyltransferase involved in cell wall biosynthesis
MRAQFHILSFEGPDAYSFAGGIATRITGLARTLAEMGLDTHLWFVGDPRLPGHEVEGRLHLHRWCQWISRYHPRGVYDGEVGKSDDYARSLPPSLMAVLEPHLRAGGSAVVLAEEWHTAHAVLHLDWLLSAHGLRDRVSILWNANNTFEFSRIDWGRLARASTITTVSRYMKHVMQPLGVEALVIPNGLSAEAFTAVPKKAVTRFRAMTGGRVVLAKVARWDPDKRWLLAVSILSELARGGLRPLLIARGGIEAHGAEVLASAAAAGLRVVDRALPRPGGDGLLSALADLGEADVVNITNHLDWESRRLLYGASDTVLANSSHEPFGLVGLETMAAGGVACTGCSGEDYAIPGHNAIVTQTSDPREFATLFSQLRDSPHDADAMRRAGRQTALQYAWPGVVRRALLPRVNVLASA